MSEYYKTGDARTLEPYFSRHMMAMTKERLDIKSDIAMELAERDQRISLLEAVAEEAVKFWTRDDVYVLDELENALRAAGYLKEQENA